ncbi:enhanced serine sensitivity protein SseB [Streptomyces roseolilacinus]|uniref:Enhanced serine sensitivity protein SseB n=1 Tax=Streptomyces roseolilacinus TaxID=66904 RepID=A0A918EMB0_9ACTN|nr:enhanced serine sensitivity protein SseB [Streptomyces roseolilacinus]GGQ31307.1 enhanced serine sensitivity protein SseB [Streptomyces roseolilacinus]
MDTASTAVDTAWPSNELEEVLSASLGQSAAGARIVEVLGRSRVWVPLPKGGSPDGAGPGAPGLDLPTLELDGLPYVPVFTSESQFRACAGDHMAYAVAPAVEFARGLPPQLGLALNPGGTIGAPLPPPAVAELCRAGRGPLEGAASGARVRLFEPDWQDDPVDFLSAARAEFEATGAVLTARRALASIEGEPPTLFVGVELTSPDADRTAPLDALGRALGAVPVPWPVNLVLLDVADDPVGDWMREKVRPFHRREHGS